MVLRPPGEGGVTGANFIDYYFKIVMEDGNILVLTMDFYGDTVEDTIVLIDVKTGEILKIWDLKNVLPQDVGGSGNQDAQPKIYP